MARRFSSVVVPDAPTDEAGATLNALLVTSLTIFFIITDAFLLHALDIYVRCGFVAWLVEVPPKCFAR